MGRAFEEHLLADENRGSLVYKGGGVSNRLLQSLYGLLVKLVKTADSQSAGGEFESPRGHHTVKKTVLGSRKVKLQVYA